MAVPLFTVVSVLSLGYGAFLASVYHQPQPDEVGAIILAKAAADRYEAEREGSCALYEFEQIGATYWFDFASSAALAHEDRTIAAWAVTPTEIRRRDSTYQRGFPMTPDHESPVDRVHLIPHLSGGEFGPNIFGRTERSIVDGLSKEGDIAPSRARPQERLGRCTSAICCTPMTPPTPNGSRSPFSCPVEP